MSILDVTLDVERWMTPLRWRSARSRLGVGYDRTADDQNDTHLTASVDARRGRPAKPLPQRASGGLASGGSRVRGRGRRRPAGSAFRPGIADEGDVHDLRVHEPMERAEGEPGARLVGLLSQDAGGARANQLGGPAVPSVWIARVRSLLRAGDGSVPGAVLSE